MAALGGSIAAVSIDGRNFAVAADADVTLTLGGKKTTPQPNGNGTARYTAEVTVWGLKGIDVAIDHDQDDLGFLQRNADAMTPVNCTITLIDGTTFQGKGIVADDHDYSTAKATAGLTLMGEGQLTPQ